ncbi:MAG: glycosyltransferase [Clostridia bacterium]|nr:glycosyltransferase [Clostridia bacterium]
MSEKNNKIKISVIIPVYNSEKTLRRCLDSVLAQTLDGIEIIVLDDGSEDNSYNIMTEYDDKYDNVRIVGLKHVGQGLARNIGLDMARGEYIGFVDSDDKISNVMYETLYNRIGDADICQCNSWLIQSHGRHKEELKPYDGTVVVTDRLKYMNDFFFTYLHSHGCCNKMFRKSFLSKNGILFADNELVYSEDMYFNILTVKYLTKIVFVNEMLYYYYQNKDSHSHAFSMDKMRKLCRLYDMTAQDDFKYILARMGVLDICTQLTSFDSDYSEILSRKDFKHLLHLALRAPEAMYQRLIILGILLLGNKQAMWIIRRYYGRFQRDTDK